MSAKQQNTLVVSRWVLPSKNVLNDELALDQRKVFESTVFGTKDEKYEFKLVLNIAEKKFRLVVMKCAEPALFGFRLMLLGLYNHRIRRIMPDFRMPDNVWLLFETENFDPAFEELVIVCNVEIKACDLFRVIYPPRPRNGQTEPSNFVRVTNAATSNKVNAFTGRVTWTVRNYHILTRTGTLNRYRIIESPIIRSADDRIQLRIILNTHTLCFNLLTLKSPCISRYKIVVQLCGLYSQVISCDEKLESDRIVWFPWEPSEHGNLSLDLHVDCKVDAEAAEEYSVSEMSERNGFLLKGPTGGGSRCH